MANFPSLFELVKAVGRVRDFHDFESEVRQQPVCVIDRNTEHIGSDALRAAKLLCLILRSPSCVLYDNEAVPAHRAQRVRKRAYLGCLPVIGRVQVLIHIAYLPFLSSHGHGRLIPGSIRSWIALPHQAFLNDAITEHDLDRPLIDIDHFSLMVEAIASDLLVVL